VSVAALQLSDTSTSTELGNKSVMGRGLFIMETLSHSSNGMSYAEISRATKLPKSTVHLGVLDGNDVVYLEKLEPKTGVKCPTQVGDRLRADKTALGKTMLAFKQGIGQKDSPFSIEREETFLGLCCIASPILDRRLRPVGAISISVPIDRFTVEKFAPQVRLAAERTARQLLGTTRQEQH
jgi:DNA-binding IclR family transcriptional regulator